MNVPRIVMPRTSTYYWTVIARLLVVTHCLRRNQRLLAIPMSWGVYISSEEYIYCTPAVLTHLVL